ncbi:Zinc finger CCCH domain-containing protein 7 [Apostasia shenzhenica]|uniref:Zinc finger CCCH domain-containing protein 7 n=1 Tax=Apostasia shenzhenica TaxID=1088818 RepID=A0A2I0B705_9ASPA|nr:Zinc finger CCCH domain-containing protein 7 [Apostasia shenzhenica]
MDAFGPPCLGRRTRYDPFPDPPFPDPCQHPPRHPHFGPPLPHPPLPADPFPWGYSQQARQARDRDPLVNYSPHGFNPLGFDRPPLPRVYDQVLMPDDRFLCGIPSVEPFMTEFRERGRSGSVAANELGGFYEGPERSSPFRGGFFKLGDAEHSFLEDSKCRSRGQSGFWDERESRFVDPFFEQLPPESASLGAERLPLPPRFLLNERLVQSTGGEVSAVLEQSPRSSDHYFFHREGEGTATMVPNSLEKGNGLGPQRRSNNMRGKSLGRKTTRRSDPGNAYKEDRLMGSRGKWKMVNNGYQTNSDKQPKQKLSAFSRIQNGVSVWKRLEEKPFSLDHRISPPRISKENKAKVDTLDISFKSDAVDGKLADLPLTTSTTSSKEDFPMVTLNLAVKKKKMVAITDKVDCSTVTDSPGYGVMQEVQKTSSLNNLVNLLKQSEMSKEAKSASAIIEQEEVVKKNDAEGVAKTISQVECSIIETPSREEGIEIPNLDDIESINVAAEIVGTGPIVDGYLECRPQGMMTDIRPTNDSGSHVTKDLIQVLPMELETSLDKICRSPKRPVISNANSPPSDHKLTSGTFLLDTGGVQDSSEQVSLEVKGFMNCSPSNNEQVLPPPMEASSLDLVGVGKFSFSEGSKTPLSEDFFKCSNIDLKAQIMGKQQEVLNFTDAHKVDVSTQLQLDAQLLDICQNKTGPNDYLQDAGVLKDDSEFHSPGLSTIMSSCSESHIVDCVGEKIENSLPLELKEMESCLHLSGTNDFNNSKFSGMENKSCKAMDEALVNFNVASSSEGDESGTTTKHHQSMSDKMQLLPLLDIKTEMLQNVKSAKGKVISKIPSRLNATGPFRETARASQTGRNRTWYRTIIPSKHSDVNSPQKLGKVPNSSYIRKGNSLIRKPAAESPPLPVPALVTTSIKLKPITERTSGSEGRVEFPEKGPSCNPLVERPKTPPLPPISKLPSCSLISENSPPQPELGTYGLNQQDLQSMGFLSSINKKDDAIYGKRVTYVKCKTNQLVAAPGPEVGNKSKILTGSIESFKESPFSSVDQYYRSKRNQLLRNAFSYDNQQFGVPADTSNSDDKRASDSCSARQSNTVTLRKRLDRALLKASENRKSSLVWTLGGDKSSQTSVATVRRWRILPYVLPWKRILWGQAVSNSIQIPERSSFSLISRKLQLSRKRGMIYTVSTDGFSLRKAGVVSIGGSNLKWSKSIEKRSRQANEEATMAVAEVERKKREKRKRKSTCGNGKKRVCLTSRSTSSIGLKKGERIYCIGSARYKMDSSKRTLIRISDDHSSSTTSQHGKKSKLSFIPRRLLIGNDEYVQIGNGNQLVRDPKKLKHILAREKVRWSLHTARLRWARKRQYCLFFTRFGKCKNSGGKCPYIHDPTKVAICTKFLKGQCSDANCKLTHKVIPERMPDCSYFLEGLCTNLNCLYRHVKVNANASLCVGFLRGHCDDGDECQKKHSYSCPLYEATGQCPKGSQCKLHHPKNRSKSKKRKEEKLRSSCQGRYFYSTLVKAGELLKVPSGKNYLLGGDDIFCFDGRFNEYVSLHAVTDKFGAQIKDPMDSFLGQLDTDCSDMQSCDIDALIKPIRIMKRGDLTIF